MPTLWDDLSGHPSSIFVILTLLCSTCSHIQPLFNILCSHYSRPDMRFVQNFTLPDFMAKNFTPSIAPNFNNLSYKNTKKSENEEIYTGGKNFTLPPAVTAWTNPTSVHAPFQHLQIPVCNIYGCIVEQKTKNLAKAIRSLFCCFPVW